MRTAELTRKTSETDIEIELDIDGTGKYEIDTGVNFFNHMLESFSRHSFIDLRLIANAPWKYLQAGMGDTIGKFFECHFASRGDQLEHSSALAREISNMCSAPLHVVWRLQEEWVVPSGLQALLC